MPTAFELPLTDRALLREQLLVAGEWVEGEGGERDAVLDPATGERIASVARGTRADARRAIEAPPRRRTPGPARRPRPAPSSCAPGTT